MILFVGSPSGAGQALSDSVTKRIWTIPSCLPGVDPMLKRTSSLGATISDKPKEQQRRGSAPPTVDLPPTTRDFVKAEGGKVKMSKEFEAAYKHLGAVNAEGKMYRDITKDLEEIAKGVEQESESLKSFIDCRVYRVSAHHLTTLDEVSWAGTIAEAVQGAYRAELGEDFRPKRVDEALVHQALMANPLIEASAIDFIDSRMVHTC